MDEDQFWSLIEQSRDAAEGDVDRQTRQLEQLLRGYSQEDLESFAGFFYTAQARLYREDCWEAGILVNTGMGDDTFTDFRAWVISRGREVYERTLQDPDSLADLPEVQDRDGCFTAERFAYAVEYVYEELYPDDYDPDEGFDFAAEAEPVSPVGPELDEDGIRRVLPRLWALRMN